ncbi:MAG: type II CRISPR RNA-guided endonuclease Cas9, partial [Pyrinomonadaceae bacterium]
MPFFKHVLGLDLGVTSIGWVLIRFECNEVGKILRDADGLIINARIIDRGVRIFPATTEDKTNAPKNFKRRTSRGQRRLVMRKAMRRNELRDLLSQNGLLPEINSANSAEVFQQLGDPFSARVHSLDHKLEPFEVGRALYHLSKRRGFLSNRKSGTAKEDGVVLGGIAKIREELESNGYRTIGELLSTKDKKRKHFTHRSMSENEYEQIWEAQKEFHPHLLSDKLKGEIKNIIFYQRPLKSQRGLIGKCTFETDKKHCDLARQEAQRMRYWQDLNNLQLQDPFTLNWK